MYLSYEEYLKSDHWKKVREMQFKQQWGRCEHCSEMLDPDHYECHHRYYNYMGKTILGREQQFPGSLTCVHPECHDELHGRNRSSCSLRELELKVSEFFTPKKPK